MPSLNPAQPFRVRYQAALSELQMQTLIQCYQPIIGTLGVGLYLTLLRYGAQAGQWSAPTMQLNLIDWLAATPESIGEAREQLEGIGLLRTYYPRHLGGQSKHPMLSFDLQSPLDPSQFMMHPLYSALLYGKLGDQSFYQLKRSYIWDEVDLSQYHEITRPFSEVFAAPSKEALAAVQEGNERAFLQQQAVPVDDSSDIKFNFPLYFQLLEQEGIEKHQFTRALRGQVQALYQLYGLSEAELVRVTRLAVNEHSQQVDYEQLRRYATQSAEAQQRQVEAVLSVDDVQQQLSERQVALREQLPHLNEVQIQIISMAEQLPYDAFLRQLKRQNNGTLTTQEYYNVKNALEKFDLPVSVMNLVVYYLIMIEKRTGIIQRDLERIADEWQQHQIVSVEKVFPYIETKRKQREKRAQQREQSKYQHYPSKRTPRHEVTPKWMKTQSQSSEATTQQLDKAALQARLQELMKKKEES